MGTREEKGSERGGLDKSGNPTTNPSDCTLRGGFITTFVTYKGYSLSVIASYIKMK